METILAVRPLVGEPGRYYVTSRTLFCSDTHGCKFSYQHKGEALPKHSPGDPCPKCGKPLETQDYLVDVTLYAGLGKCGCHRWQFHLQPLVAKMSPAEIGLTREADLYRCQHLISALRFFALEQIDNMNRALWRSSRRHQGQGE